MRLTAVLPLLLAGFLASTSTAGEITTPEQLFPQLDGILRQAVAQSPRMISQAIDLQMAEEDKIVARAAILPTVGGYYSYYQSSDTRGDLSGRLKVTKVAYNFSVNQPLYHWGEKRNIAKMGEIRESIAQGNFQEAYRGLAQEVRSQYCNLIIAKLRVQQADFSLNRSKNLLAQAEDRLKKKVISDAQIFSVRIEADRAQITADRTRFMFETDLKSFARLIGADTFTAAQVPDAIPAVYSPEDAVQRLLAEFLAQKDPPSTAAENFRKFIDIDRLTLKNQKTRLRPKLNLVAGASQDEQSYTVNVAQKYQVNSYYGGLSVSWTIFDGFSAGAGVRSALASLRKRANDYRALTEQLATQAQSQAKYIGFFARDASISDRFLISGEGNMNSKKEEFARGVVAEEDVGLAQLNLFESQITAYKSRAEYYRQLGEFLGTIMADPVVNNLTKQ